MVMEIRLM